MVFSCTIPGEHYAESQDGAIRTIIDHPNSREMRETDQTCPGNQVVDTKKQVPRRESVTFTTGVC